MHFKTRSPVLVAFVVHAALSASIDCFGENNPGLLKLAQSVTSDGTGISAVSVKTEHLAALLKVAETKNGAEMKALACSASLSESIHFFAGNMTFSGIVSVARDPCFSVSNSVFRHNLVEQSFQFKTAASGNPMKAAFLATGYNGKLGIYLEQSESDSSRVAATAQMLRKKKLSVSSVTLHAESIERQGNPEASWFDLTVQKKNTTEFRPALAASYAGELASASVYALGYCNSLSESQGSVRLESSIRSKRASLEAGLFTESAGYTSSGGTKTDHPFQCILQQKICLAEDKRKNILAGCNASLLYQRSRPKEWYLATYPDWNWLLGAYASVFDSEIRVSQKYERNTAVFTAEYENQKLINGHASAGILFTTTEAEKTLKTSLSAVCLTQFSLSLTMENTFKDSFASLSVKPEAVVRIKKRHVAGSFSGSFKAEYPERNFSFAIAASLELK